MKSTCAALFALTVALAGAGAARANDGIFPPSPAAKSFIDFDGKGFLIGGKRTFIASGSLHYARVPRALWRDRLLRFKRAGFNTVESYVFWNYHEPAEGKFDFSGEKDLNAFLKLVKELGMYAIVRVGPYSCAEWDQGGFPVWLRFKPGVRVREDNPEFERLVDRWFDRLLPIVAANQIQKGGPVILVQLENEHPQGWGTEMPNGYFRHLKEKAEAAGLGVPLFFSGLHHGSDPAGNRSWDSAGRTNPWFTTEFWPGWYDLYGELSPANLRRFDRGIWKILAYGGNGYNFYMLHGGTNFDYWNNQEDASSYDYGAAVGQAGDLRTIYYRFKRATLFAQSFPSILEDSANADAKYAGYATNDGVKVTARTSPAGDIVFLDNPGQSPATTDVKDISAHLTLAPGEIAPVVTGYSLGSGVTLSWAARLLGIAAQGDTTTLVVYGPAGSSAPIGFVTPPFGGVTAAEGAVTIRGGAIRVDATFPAGGAPAEYGFTAGGHRFRILAVSDALADDTWFVDAAGKTYVVCGPDYIGDVAADPKTGKLSVRAEYAWNRKSTPANVVYGPDAASIPLPTRPIPAYKIAPPALGAWSARTAADAAAPGFSDKTWFASDAVPEMGVDGDVSAYAWYRTTLRVPAAGEYRLSLPSHDYAQPFLDGKPVSVAGPLALTAGDHSLAVFTSHHGRDKVFGYLGPLDARDPKGVIGRPSLTQPGPDAGEVTGWRMLPVDGRPASAPPAADAAGWTVLDGTGGDSFHGRRGYAWFAASLPAPAAGAPQRVLHFDGVDDNATVYLNGKRIAYHEGWDEPFDVSIPADAWSASGGNTLAVLAQNTDGGGGLRGQVTLASYRYNAPIAGWKLRGGPGGDPLAAAGWRPLAAGERAAVPTFYRASFQGAAPGAAGPHPILRVTLPGMTRGSVWLNGHNLGRYPEKVPVDGIYLPECWLKAGENSLVIFDEEGARPDRVALSIETAASRIADVLAER